MSLKIKCFLQTSYFLLLKYFLERNVTCFFSVFDNEVILKEVLSFKKEKLSSSVLRAI